VNSDSTDVAVIGAGPYGLSLAAHLSAAGVRRRIFGEPMGFWCENMPRGMVLKSQGAASSLHDPLGIYSLEAYCLSTQGRCFDYRTPVPRDVFVEYGGWFQRNAVPDVERILVTDVTRCDDGFELTLAGSERVRARSVVVAVGMKYFSYVPPVLSQLPGDLVSHSSDHTDLAAFRDRDVVVVGSGQSGLESAALLNEHGARVRVMARSPQLVWNGDPLPPDRPRSRRLREPTAALGSGWATWFYSRHPELFQYLPAAERLYRARTALGPAGAWWLRDRIEGTVPVLLGHTPLAAEPVDGGACLRTRAADGSTTEVQTEHVIAATGYRPRAADLTFLAPSLRAGIRTLGAAPDVDVHFESSVPGLYFAGAAVATRFGPVMRFVWGAHFAARNLTRHLARNWGGARVRA
jgi:FAD-dependent urate hydroxylase